MPVISRFYGLVIKMYFQQKEHQPPHIHVSYGEFAASIVILSGDLFEGDLPPKALALVREWLSLHRNEVMHIWNTQEFIDIPGLE